MSQPPLPPPTRAEQRDATLRLLPSVLTVFLGFLAIGIPLPVLPGQVHEALGFSTVVVGVVIGAQSVATLLSRHMAGTLVDTRGPKLASLIGLGLAALSGVALLLSARPGIGASASLALVLGGRVLLGVGESLFLTGALTWGIGTVGPRFAGKVMAWNGIAMYGALAAGASVGVAVGARYGFGAVAAVVIVLPLGGLALAAMRQPVAPVGGKRIPFTRVIGAIWQPGAALGLATVGYATLASFLVLLYASRGWNGAGLALTAFGACYILVRLLFGGLPDRLGTRRVVVPSLLIEAGGQVLIWVAPSPEIALLGAAITGAGFSLLFPACGLEAVRRVPPQNRGAALSAFAAFFDIALGVAGPVTGVLAGRLGYSAAFGAGALCALAALPVVLSLQARGDAAR